MTIPLMVLAFFSIVAGYAGLPLVVGEKANLFFAFLDPVMHAGHEAHLEIGTEWLLILISTAVALLGIFIAYLFYIRDTSLPHALVRRFPRLYRLLYNKYYVDEIYNAVIVNPLLEGSDWIYGHFDVKVIDGAANGAADTTGFLSRWFSRFQTGWLKDYALIFLLGVIILLGYLLF